VVPPIKNIYIARINCWYSYHLIQLSYHICYINIYNIYVYIIHKYLPINPSEFWFMFTNLANNNLP
jgi:hypothetical protein